MRFYNVFRKETDPFSEKAKWVIIVSCISPVLFMVIYSQFLPSDCENFHSQKINGVILNKYIDSKNHNSMTISIQTEIHEITRRPLEFQDTILFRKLKINDLLEKPSGKNYYIINHLDTIPHVCND